MTHFSARERPIEILLVEDCRADEELTLHTLRKHRLANAIHVARDGAEALDYLARGGRYAASDHADPQLILLDLKLPKVSGLEVLRQLKRDPATAAIPVAVLTASPRDCELDEIRGLGVSHFLPKPVSFEEFAEIVRQLGVRWVLLDDPALAGCAAA